MKVLDGDFEAWVPPEGGAAVAVGVFDGVHRGHQAVLAGLTRRAAELGGLVTTVLTFDRHPLEVIAPDRAPRLLTTPQRRAELLAAAGVERLAVLTFDERVRGMTPEDFAAEVLVGALGASLVTVGADFRFGKDRSGDVTELKELGLGLGYYVEEVDLLGDGAPVSSTRIRAAVAAGDVAEAAAQLGRLFELVGEVVEGDRRGATIGFPTANLALPDNLLLPGRGVYAAWVEVGGAMHPAVVNVGVRPTFGGEREMVEAHLLDFDGDLYGRELSVRFVARLRDEQRFAGVDELVAQIGRDVVAGRARLAR